MKRACIYFLIGFVSASTAFSQDKKASEIRLPFQDSVRNLLENTRATDAMAVGMALTSLWEGLGVDQQIVVMKQAKLMKRKGFKLRPHFKITSAPSSMR